jgi:type IV pilus assembly protein PilA
LRPRWRLARLRSDRGFTLIELLIVVGLIGTLAAIAASSMLNARISGNEASAVGSMRAIVSAEMDFTSANGGYAVSLATLSAMCPGMTVGFISPDLNANGVEKNGFQYSIVAGAGGVVGPNDCNGAPTRTAFYATAAPVSIGLSGNRGFASNQDNTIWQDSSGALPTEPFTTAGTVGPIGR